MRNDIQRIENQPLPSRFENGTSKLDEAVAIKHGLIAIAYAIQDVADATRNPDWMKEMRP